MTATKELVVLSGKGGTGKTSIVAAFAALAAPAVLADCDVDAADLHLVLQPRIGDPHEFSGRSAAAVDTDTCTGCARCRDVCRFGAVSAGPVDTCEVDATACEGCGLCVRVCPAGAMRMAPVVNGSWMLSRTRFGPLVHARLGVAEDNSGKLVTLVRARAREVAEQEGLSLVIVDGSPGIGCPVIASLAGAHLAIAVTEPTVSGRHDLDRVLQVVNRFRTPFGVLINKADINRPVAGTIVAEAHAAGALFVRTAGYDPRVTEAQVAGTDMITYGGQAATAVRRLWHDVLDALAAAHTRDATRT